MSWLDGMIEGNEAASQDERLDRTAELPQPGFFSGAGTQLFRGAGTGLGTLALQAAQYGNDPDQAILMTVPTDEEETARRAAIGQQRQDFSESMKPDPTTVGTAGQILFGLGDVGSRFALGVASGGPVIGAGTVGTSVGEETFSDLKAKGVDTGTALGAGVVQGAAASIGAVLPAARIVGPLLGDAALTVGANVGLGIASRGATGSILERNGYTAQAAQYKAFDKTAVLTDAVLGAAFFGVGRMSGGARPTTEQIDAALTERTAQHADIDTAPGAPINPRSAVAHQDAIRTAIEQLQRGEPVTVPESIHSAEFLRATDEPRAVAPTRDEALASARAELEPTLRTELEQQVQGAAPNVRDIRTELANLSKSLDGIDDSFKDRAKQFQQDGQSRKQAESSARQAIAAEREELTGRQSTLNDTLASNRNAEQARADLGMLDRGDIPPRFADRLTQRADAIVKGFEPNKLAAGVAEGNKLSIEQIGRAEINRALTEIENARAQPTAKELDIGQRAQESAPGGKPAAQDKPASKAPKSASNAKNSASDVKQTASNDGGKPETAGNEAASDPVLQVADEILSRADDVRISTGAMDADGKAVTVSARELMAEADADIARAEHESQGFFAAAACFLQRGQ